ncbi:YaaA family protein, partial [Atopobiaceae bacterium LCP21S3_F7]
MSFSLIVSPAKRMEVVDGPPHASSQPRFREEAARLAHAMRELGYDGCKRLWRCSDELARLNYDRLLAEDPADADDPTTTAAVVAYRGIQYQHLAPAVMDERELDYLGRHLRILSGLYGVLRPFDGVVPYRLEMQAKLAVDGAKDLYAFWGDRIVRALAEESDTIVNLASVEYAKAVTRHVGPRARGGSQVGRGPGAGSSPGAGGSPRVLTCLFGEPLEDGRLRQRATEAKAARGTFVRWCAEQGVEDASDLAGFAERGYRLDEERSDEGTLVLARA